MIDLRRARLETVAVHAGHEIDSTTGAVSTPIHLSTTFERDVDGNFPRGFIYSRTSNPNRQALEKGMAIFEGGAGAAAFATGMAACMAVFQALRPGDRVIAPADAYYGTTKLLRDVFLHWGIKVVSADLTNAAELDQAFGEPVRLIWIETPSNPLLKITDIAAITKRGHEVGAICVCDNTWAPAVQRPFELGADLVMYSTTKYIGGHCDVTGGVIVSKENTEVFEQIRTIQAEAGGVPSPFDSWLVLRGLRTLPWRMRAHSENAMAIAKFLAAHGNVDAVYYPGLPSHSGHDIAVRQMRQFSGMLSFEVKGGREAAMAVAGKTKIFIRATSLGGVESLVEHRASIEGPTSRAPEGLLRLSIGLEHAEDLMADLDQALA